MRAILFGLLGAALLTKAVDAQQVVPPSWLPGAQFDAKQPPRPTGDALNRGSASRVLPGCKLFLAVPDPNVTLLMASEEGYCSGIIQSIRFMMHFFNEFLPDELRSCSENANNGQVVRVVIAYIERRPQRMHELFNVLALEAMHEAWPCR